MTEPAFDDLCHRVHREMGGRATAEDVAVHVVVMLTDERFKAINWKGFVGQVRSALRRRDADTGLPEAPCVAGVYVQESLLTEDEYRALISGHMQAAGRSKARATRYAEQCLAVHQVWIDPEQYVADSV